MGRTGGEVPVSISENKLKLQMNARMLDIRASLGLDPLPVEMKGGPGITHSPAEWHLSLAQLRPPSGGGIALLFGNVSAHPQFQHQAKHTHFLPPQRYQHKQPRFPQNYTPQRQGVRVRRVLLRLSVLSPPYSTVRTERAVKGWASTHQAFPCAHRNPSVLGVTFRKRQVCGYAKLETHPCT